MPMRPSPSCSLDPSVQRMRPGFFLIRDLAAPLVPLSCGESLGCALVFLPSTWMGSDAPESRSSSEDELNLIESVLAGDPQPFEVLLRPHLPRLFSMARRYARREVEAQDLVQEILLKVYQKLPGFRREAPFEYWLMRIAVRTCYDYLRACRRRREQSWTDLDPESAGLVEKFHAAEGSGDSADTQEAVRQLVHQVLEQLSAPARLVLTLQEIEGKSVKEIAALTGWSIPLVKVRAFRARAELRKRLSRMQLDQYL